MVMKSKPTLPKLNERADFLRRQQQLKMARSAHAYVRGNTLKFYEWLETAKGRVPDGPPIWICGDCHVGNLGPVADAKGHVEIEIRDLDQTVIGNPAHDLIRLGLSLATAARGSDLPGVTTALMLEQMIVGYTLAFKGQSKSKPALEKSESIRIVLKQALKRKWRHLAKERIEDVRPSIPLGQRFWALSKEEKSEIARLFDMKDVKTLARSLRERDNDSEVEVMDAAYWMKGCSSLGRLRYAALLRVGRDLCLFDIKEAVKAAAPGYKAADIPRNHAERLVAGARALSPYLGGRMLPEKFHKIPVVLRELRPQDLKLELDQITRQEAVTAAKFLAGVVGRAHARQMSTISKRKWVTELKQHQGKTIDAPTWLWTSVVELVADHEIAYLEHCRRYALST
jgi:uncharacterized protein (DUF2252 family)